MDEHLDFVQLRASSSCTRYNIFFYVIYVNLREFARYGEMSVHRCHMVSEYLIITERIPYARSHTVFVAGCFFPYEDSTVILRSLQDSCVTISAFTCRALQKSGRTRRLST